MKVTITGGAGGIGSSVAFNLVQHGVADEVVLADRRPQMIASHVMDLEQVLALDADAVVRGGDADDYADSDVIVLAAGAPLTVNTSRMVFLDANVAIAAETIDRLPADWGGILLVVTNPVDPLCTWITERTGFDRRRVIGYTFNDSLRLRTGIGKALGVPCSRVDAWVLGEHGDASVPLLDRVSVDDRPVTLTERQQADALDYLRGWYVRHVALDSGRTSTWTTGLGVALMTLALRDGDEQLWPTSIVLRGEYAIDGVAVSVPVTLGPGGVEAVHEWPLTAQQREALHGSAALVREAMASMSPASDGSLEPAADGRDT